MKAFRSDRRLRRRASWAALILAAAACGGGAAETSGESDDGEATSSLTPFGGPIVDIVPAASIGEDGRPIDPAFVFGTDAEQITIVVTVGEVTDSPLSITWTHVTDQGDEELFTHTVEVSGFDTGYSIGESPGLLAVGTYDVRATLGGESRSTRFEVQSPDGSTAVGQSAESGPPSPGGSGVAGPPTPGPSETVVFTLVSHAPEDPSADTVRISVIAGVQGGGGRVDVKVTMNGSTRTLSFPTDAEGLVSQALEFRPCSHPGGSDLPGARLRFDSIVYQGDAEVASTVDLVTLGPDDSRPAVTLHANPPSGSRVKPGDKILFDVTAQEARSGSSWQTGLRELRVRAIPGEDLVPLERADSDRAEPCASKQWSLATQGSYTVPDDPPATFRICPLAVDFAGNQNGDTCATYSTVDGAWTGTIDATSEGACGTAMEHGTVELSVSGQVVSGQIDASGSYSCEGVTVQTAGTTLLVGTLEDDEFRLGVDGMTGLLLGSWNCLVGQPFTIPVHNGAGSATFTSTAPSGDVYSCTITIQSDQSPPVG